MTFPLRAAFVCLGVLIVLGLANLEISGRRDVLANGTRLYLPLVPGADEGSLAFLPAEMRPGAFRRRFAPSIRPASSPGTTRSAMVIVTVDERKIVRSVRYGHKAEPESGEHALHYRGRGQFRFLGRDIAWNPAWRDTPHYAVLHVAADGTAVLSGLADSELKRIDKTNAGPDGPASSVGDGRSERDFRRLSSCLICRIWPSASRRQP